MGLLWNATFENNNASELSAPLTAGFDISSAFADASAFSLHVGSAASIGAETLLKGGLLQYTLYTKLRLFIDHHGSPPSLRDAPFIVWRDQADAVVAYLMHRQETFGSHRLIAVNQVGATFTSSYPLTENAWHTVEAKLVISPTAGVLQLLRNGALLETLSAQNTGTSPIKLVMGAGGGFTEFDTYTDNYRVMTNVYPTQGEPLLAPNKIRPRAFAPGLAR